MRSKLFFSFFFFSILLAQSMNFCANNYSKKLVVVLSNPRSLSTAFLRMMEARGDCFISLEPGRKHREEAPAMVLAQCKEHDFVCIKEMGENARRWLLGEELEALFLDQAHFVFLVRNPHDSLMSFYRVISEGYGSLDQKSLDKLRGYVPLGKESMPDYWWDLSDYKKLYDMYNNLLEKSVHKPIIIIADDLVNSPEVTIRSMCKNLNIPFDTSCLQWDSLSLSSNTYDHKITCKLWYKNALQSTGFSKQLSGPYVCDSNGEPTFEEIANLKHREQHVQLYRKSMPFYKRFVDAAQRCQVKN